MLDKNRLVQKTRLAQKLLQNLDVLEDSDTWVVLSATLTSLVLEDLVLLAKAVQSKRDAYVDSLAIERARGDMWQSQARQVSDQVSTLESRVKSLNGRLDYVRDMLDVERTKQILDRVQPVTMPGTPANTQG